MPIYEYRCPSCDLKFEKLRPFSRADDPAACPSCQGERTTRCLSTFAAFSKSSTAVSGAGAGHGCGNCGGGSCGNCKH